MSMAYKTYTILYFHILASLYLAQPSRHAPEIRNPNQNWFHNPVESYSQQLLGGNHLDQHLHNATLSRLNELILEASAAATESYLDSHPDLKDRENDHAGNFDEDLDDLRFYPEKYRYNIKHVSLNDIPIQVTG